MSATAAIAGGAPIAIVGIGCRFPGGIFDSASFWRLLTEERNAITEIPPDRIDVAQYFDARGATPGKMMTRWGGFLEQIDKFDAEFFGISPREAERLDPQQRLLLELSWEALEDAGQDINRLEGTRTSVFIGQWLGDFEARLFANPEVVDFYATTGSGRYASSGRISYCLGLRGPSLTLDTACSSSLTAVHLAVRSLRSGESQLSIAGGVNIILQPQISIAYSQSLMMAADGRCKFGDARGDGYVRSEGAGVVVLKPLDRALADGDRVYAVIRGSAVNNDGRSSGSMGTPSATGQEELLRSAYRDAGCSAGDVGYVEAHGTGTRAGDPVELGALGAVLCVGRRPGFKARVGSIKTNLGHTEGAAGVAGLIKVALALHHGWIPASLNCTELNPAVDWDGAPYEIARQASPWIDERRLGGVSAFGIAGSNAHVVLEQAPMRGPITRKSGSVGPCILPLSARSPKALRELTGAYAELLASPQGASLIDVSATAALHRTALEYRASFTAETADEIVDQLRRFAGGEEGAAPAFGQSRWPGNGRLAFVCPGQGAQWHGMVRELIASECVFRASIERAEAALRPFVSWSLMAQLQGEQGDCLANRISVIQPVLVAVEIALAELWRSRGVEPQAVVGHSMGEIAAAYIAGVLELEAAMGLVCRRSALMEQTAGNGAMAVVDLSAEQAADRLRPHGERASVAVINSSRSCVISGEPSVIASIVADLERDGIFARLITVDVASHNPQMNPLIGDLVGSQTELRARSAELALYSTVEAARCEGMELGADYWGRNLRETVRFGETVAAMIRDGITTYIELGPHPTLLNAITQVAADCRRNVVALPSLRRNEPERLQLLRTIGELFVAGHDIDWRSLFPDGYERVDPPHYPWQRERYWLDVATPVVGSGSSNVFLGASVTSSIEPETCLWNVEISLARYPYLADHVVNGVVVLPAAVFLEMVLEAARQIWRDDRVQLSTITIETALVLPQSGACLLQIALEPAPTGGVAFTISSRSGDGRDVVADGWTRHACGLILDHLADDACEDRRHGPPGTETVVSAEAHYTKMKLHGLAYGPTFRGLCELRKIDGTAVASVKLPDELRGGEYRVHPALLDACLQVGIALSDRTSPATYVPIAIERLRLLQTIDGASPVTVRAALRHDPAPTVDRFVADFQLAAADGTPLLDINQVTFARLTRGAEASPGNFYRVAWAPDALVSSLPPPPMTWSVLAARQGVGADLASRLGATDAMAFPGGAALRDALAHVLRQPTDSGAMHGIVHLWSLDAQAPEDATDALAAASELGCLSVLTLVQLVALSAPAQRQRVYLVTAGAQAVLDGERPSISQAPLWGLGRVIANEHPELSCTLIDLSARPTAAEVAALARELGANSSEQQIALRGEQRFVARLLNARLDDPIVATAPAGEPFCAHVATPGIPDSLRLKAAPRVTPGPGEVEIEITATGLNFMNVMSALGIYPGYRDGVGPLGIECSGQVTAVGCGVDVFRVGDEVMAVAFDCLASHAVTDARLVRRKPTSLSFAEAASIPIAFLTASHSLNDLARVERGERVLIHAATGGVGLAALQLARKAGAEIFATAGTGDKRALLASMGVKHVLDSRSLTFRDQILEQTGGSGVDVVLNSLPGKFIPASLAVLAPYGRFVEIGKRDIHRNARIGLAPFQRNLSFFAVDLDRMIRERPAVLAKTFDRVVELIARGALQPLPVTEFPISRVAEAFRLMARAGHVGKIVVTGHDAAARVFGTASEQLVEMVAGTCVITGGLGDLGLAVAERLVALGARSLALIGRSAPAAARRDTIRSLEVKGATVRAIMADVASAEQIAEAFADVAATMPPVSAVFHAAGVLDDGVLVEQTAKRFATVMAPKIDGTWNLCKLLADRPNVNLILFSSITSLLGLPGQGSYAAGNAFLDAVAAYRRAMGGRATSINWGPWRDIGLAAAQSTRAERLASRGLGGLSPARALDALEHIIGQPSAGIAVVEADWSEYRHANGRATLSLLTSLLGDAAESSAPSERRARDIILAAELGAPRRTAIEAAIKQQVARVLRQSTSRIDTARPFRNLGLDSLMGLELRNRLESELLLSLPATVVWNYPTIAALAAHLESLLEPPAAGPASARQSDLPADEIETILSEIENLSPEQARELLAADDVGQRPT